MNKHEALVMSECLELRAELQALCEGLLTLHFPHRQNFKYDLEHCINTFSADGTIPCAHYYIAEDERITEYERAREEEKLKEAKLKGEKK